MRTVSDVLLDARYVYLRRRQPMTALVVAPTGGLKLEMKNGYEVWGFYVLMVNRSSSPFPKSRHELSIFGAKAGRPKIAFHLSVFSCPVEMSACLESLQPFHTATASTLMTSMLTLSQRGYAWLPEGI
ncbi:hypothetical protein L1987_01806 [Smallanthus sonchifolius]|uniref:Uncharacterized protein n=1 Tax=Smallanthus sonchifolius TaxID=185202 RepID=A0ACB9K661_9ASTR|nr:hypothetical protein L1987_01806 [Smallanthus sonchifolius]